MASEATRVTLIKCMKRLVRQQSFSRITVAEICESAHISRRSFYRYFPDKYLLLNATYVDCFFSKIKVDPDGLFWDIFKEICTQIYSERDFFRHAFEVKGQNGFWEETRALLVPCMRRDYPSDMQDHKMLNFFVFNDVNMLFQLIEEWIRDDLPTPPEEFAAFVQNSFAVYGKWLYEVSTNRPRTSFRFLWKDSKENR